MFRHASCMLSPAMFICWDSIAQQRIAAQPTHQQPVSKTLNLVRQMCKAQSEMLCVKSLLSDTTETDKKMCQ